MLQPRTDGKKPVIKNPVSLPSSISNARLRPVLLHRVRSEQSEFETLVFMFYQIFIINYNCKFDFFDAS